MKEIQIKIHTKQKYNTHTDSQSEIYKGTIYNKNNNTYIIYKEENDGLVTTNQIKVSQDNEITIRRMGSVRTVLNFKEDKSYTTFYNTNYGSLELTFVPNKIISAGSDDNYNIIIDYDIYSQDEKLSSNTYSLLAKKVN